MMLMVLVTAAAVAVLMVMVFMMVVLMMLMVLVTAAAVTILVVMVVMVLVMMVLQLLQILCNRGSALHCLQQLRAGQLRPGGGDQSSCLIMLAQQLHGGIQLCLGDRIGPGQDDGGSGFDLVIIELAKVLHIDLDLARIGNGHLVAQANILIRHLLNGCYHIGQLTNTGRFNDNTVRMVLGNYFLQRLAKVTHQGAADAAGVHLGNVDTGLLQEAAIDADLTEFVLNEHQLLTAVGLLNHFFDESCLTCAQKTGININNRHG